MSMRIPFFRRKQRSPLEQAPRIETKPAREYKDEVKLPSRGTHGMSTYTKTPHAHRVIRNRRRNKAARAARRNNRVSR